MTIQNRLLNSNILLSFLQNEPEASPTGELSGSSSLADYPKIKRQIENFKYLSDWDEDTSALLKLVAGKLHSHQVMLSPQYDNEQFLIELEAFDGSRNYRSASPYLLEFFQKVAVELERDPGHYQALLSSTSDGKLVAPSRMSYSEYQEHLKIINELEVRDLSFLFNDEPVEEPPKAETTPPVGVEALIESKKNRTRRSTSITSETIPQHMSALINETGLRDSRTLSLILQRIDRSDEVINSHSRPPAERNVIRLLKLIDVLVPRQMDFAPPFRQFADGLLQIADGLSDIYGQSKVWQFKQEVFGGTWQPALATEENPTSTDPLTDQQLAGRIKRSSERTLQQLQELYHPILDPSAFIDDYIKKGISRYEQQTATVTWMGPDSLVRVTYHPGPYDPTMVPPYKRAPSSTTVSVPLRDVITGHYLYDFKQARDSLDRRYSFPRTTFEPAGLIGALTQENLQTVMEQALSTYRTDPAKRSGLTAHYQNMIKLRCLAYLDSPNKDSNYEQAVKSFLTGSIQAKEMSFRGTKLNGVFLIPSGEAGGVLFSVDEPGFFHIGNQSRTYIRAMGRRVTETTATFPHSDEFKSWVLNKMPSYTAQEYKNRPNSIFESIVVTNAQMNFPTTRSIDRPVSFSETENPRDLANKLFDGLMERLDLDIDRAVFSSFEQTTEHWLEVAKAVLTIPAAALSVAVPGTGTVLSRVALFLANLAVDVAYVAAVATQAHLADRPEDAATFRNEAIIAGVLGGVGAVTGGTVLTRQGVEEALDFYRRAKLASGNAIASAMGNAGWKKLTDPKKIELLVNTMKDSEPARNLARLTTPEVVEQAIRRNLTLDFEGTAKTRFSWGELAGEQAQVQRRLDSDLVRLNDTNAHMRRILDSPPAVPREALLFEPEQAAADWITRQSRTAATSESFSEFSRRIKHVLSENRQADLLDISTIDRLHNAVYQPAAGQTERVFRSSSDSLFMGS
ncbi:hypothetical protein SAMN05660489_05116, partial [Pseudomonas sp. LAMO17WK12:I10]|uniref:hypothetical protein n=1 Tax=unclassified Pseudomonas TaxID=196821 RepID=UPI000BDD95D1